MPLRWGIVAAGKISHDFVNAINSYPDKGNQVIAAVADRIQSFADDFAKLHKIPKVFATYQEMALSSDIDVAYIGALNPEHYELSMLFLESGKHVLCEKPLCLNYKQAESLIKFAKSKDLFFMEAIWSRFCPLYISLEKEINSGKLGDIQFVEVNFGQLMTHVDRLRKKELGGSTILDVGTYAVQFAQFIFKDEPIKITAVGELNEEGVDVVDIVILEYPGGRRAVLHVNAKIKLWNKATVVGTLGRATFLYFWYISKYIYIIYIYILGKEPFHFADTLIHVDGSVEKLHLHTSDLPYKHENSAGLVYEALEVVRCIENGYKQSPRMTHQNSLTQAKIIEAIRKQVGVQYDVDNQEF